MPCDVSLYDSSIVQNVNMGLMEMYRIRPTFFSNSIRYSNIRQRVPDALLPLNSNLVRRWFTMLVA